MKVHVVEDEKALEKAAVFFLKTENVEVTTSSSGGTAVADILAAQPDVILLDLVLPEKSGMEVLKDLRTAGVKTSVVVMTNLDVKDVDRTELTRYGVRTILTKVHTQFSELATMLKIVMDDEAERERSQST